MSDTVDTRGPDDEGWTSSEDPAAAEANREADAQAPDPDDFSADEAPASAVDHEASNITFIPHDFIADEGAVKEGSEVPSNLLVGREGEDPEPRAELTDPDGEVVNQAVQVDTHDNEGIESHVAGH